MATPNVLALTGYGINCDEETKFAFDKAGARTDIVHINDLIDGHRRLDDYQVLAFPGGFSYGDDTGSGNALANRIRNHLWGEVQRFVEDDFGNIFFVNKGTGGFTEEGIYHAIPLDGHSFIPFFGGEKVHKFAEKFVREDAKNNKGIIVKYFSGECLILSMDGSAGCMTYKPNGEKFTLNHHAATITIKPTYKKKINLKWFKHEYQKTLIDSAVSKKSSRTLSKEVLESIVITAPTPTEQEAWVKEIEELELLNDKLEKINNHITLLTEKEITV